MAIDPQLLAMMMQRVRPNALPPTLAPLTRAPTPNFNPAQQVKGEGTSRILSLLMGLNPNLQQPGISGNPAMKAGLTQAGLSLLAAPKTKGTFNQNIANALGYGQQAAQGAQAQQQQQAMLANLPPQMRQMLSLLSPEARDDALLNYMKPREGFTLPQGNVRYNADGTVAAYNPAAPEKPEKLDSAMQAGMAKVVGDPFGSMVDLTPEQRDRVIDFAMDYRRSGVAQPAAGVEKEKFEWITSDIRNAITAGSGALEQVAALDRAISLTASATQGFGADLRLGLNKFANLLGMDVSGITDTEELRTEIGKHVLEGASAMKGSLSDNDIKFLKESIGQLTNNAETNRRIFAKMKARIEMAKGVREHAIDYMRRHPNGVDLDYYDELDALKKRYLTGDLSGGGATPMTADELKERYGISIVGG